MKRLIYKMFLMAAVAICMLSSDNLYAQGTTDLFNYSACTINYFDWDYGTTDGQNYKWVPKLRSNADGERHKIITTGNTIGTDPNVPITELPQGNNTAIRLGTSKYNTVYNHGSIVSTEYAKGGGVIFQYKVTENNAVIYINYAAMLTDPMPDHVNALKGILGMNAWNPYLNKYSKISDYKTFYEPTDWQFQQPYVDFYLGVDGSEMDCTFLYELLYDESGQKITLSSDWKTKSFSISDGTANYNYDSYYKDWSLMAVDLTPYIGHTISLVAEYRDCAMAGWYYFQEDTQYESPQIYTCDDHHLARLYLNASCSPAAITLDNKDCSKRQVTCSAPVGFASYKWFTSTNPDVTLSTSQTCTYTFTKNGEENDLCCTVTSLLTNGCAPGETTMKLHIVNDCLEEETVNLTLCSCDLPYRWNGIDCSETKRYNYHTVTSDGLADSIVYLNLTVLTSTDMPLQEAVFCDGTTYNWSGHTSFGNLSEAKTYFDTVFYSTTDSYGKRCAQYCYSLRLDMNPKINVVLSQTLCYDDAAAFWSGHSFDKPLPAVSAEPITISVSETIPSLLTGCDSTTTYNLTLNPTTYGTDNQWVCADDLASAGFTWGGKTYYTLPTVAPRQTLVSTYGCDSIVTLNLQVDEVVEIEETTTFCLGDLPDFSAAEEYTYTFVQDNHSLSVKDTLGAERLGRYYVYRDTVRNIRGCDSVRYALKAAVVRPVVMPTEVRYRCANDMMAGEDWYIEGWAEHNAKEEYEAMALPGLYEDTLRSKSGGCDSIIYSLEIIEYPAYARYKLSFTDPEPVDYRTKLGTVYIAEGESFRCGNNDYNSTGDHEEKTQTIHGCDSIIVFRLEVLPDMEHIYDTVCENMLPYIWHHNDGEDGSYTASGDYTFSTKTIHATDSTAVLHLTVLTATSMPVEKITICSTETYDWSGHPAFTGLNETKLYADTARYIYGCDSVYYTLDLTVLPAPADSAYSRVVCKGETYTDSYFSGITAADTYYASVPYFGTACDSVRYVLTVKDDCSSLEATVKADTVCADDSNARIAVSILAGKPESMVVLFDDKGHSAGWRDTSITDVAELEQIVYVDMPVVAEKEKYLRPDDYPFTVRISDAFGDVTTYEGTITVIYPSWVIMQRWQDVLMVQNERYNGGFVFSSIAWEADGRTVEGRGEHNGYLRVDGGLKPEVAYRALLTRADDGKTLPTCDVYYTDTVSEKTLLSEESIYISPRGGNYRMVKVEADCSGSYIIYAADGKRIGGGKFGAEYMQTDIQFPLSAAQGIYLIRFSTDSGNIITRKWQVK